MIRAELRKQVLRLRTYIGFGLVALLPVIITIAVNARPGRGDRGDPLSHLATASGINMALLALEFMSGFFLIVVVALFSGETVSGEANWGTLRYLLVRPVGRSKLLAAKLAVAVLLSVAATFLITLVALAVGTAFFGWHPVIGLSLTTYSQGSAVLRLLLATLYIAWAMTPFITFSFMLSTMTDSAFGAVAGGVALGVVSEILDGVLSSGWFRDGFPTRYVDRWQELFQHPTHTSLMVRGIIVPIPYIVLFLGIAWWWFRRKDVLS